MAFKTSTFVTLHNYIPPLPDELNSDYWEKETPDPDDIKDSDLKELFEDCKKLIGEFEDLRKDYKGKLKTRLEHIEGIKEKIEKIIDKLDSTHEACDKSKEVNDKTTKNIEGMLDTAKDYKKHMENAIDTYNSFYDAVDKITKLEELLGTDTEELFKMACDADFAPEYYEYLEKLGGTISNYREFYETYIDGDGEKILNSDWTKEIRAQYKNVAADAIPYEDVDYESVKKNMLTNINMYRDLRGRFQKALWFDWAESANMLTKWSSPLDLNKALK